MGKRNKEKELKRSYGMLAESMEDYCLHLDLRPITELDDDAFAFIMANVKGVDMLDLMDAAITAKSVQLLTRLEYVHELRIKDCENLDDTCIAFLNQLPTLTFLQLKSTSVTAEGILQLNLPQLKELQFTVADTTNLAQKMKQLQQQLPSCSFTVNSKPWSFDETTQSAGGH